MKLSGIVHTVYLLGGTFVFHTFGLHVFAVLLVGLILLSVLDVLSGYYKNEPSERTSNKLSRGITARGVKIMFASILALVVYALAGTITDEWIASVVASVPLVIVFGWVLSEMKSIAENIHEMTGDDVTKSVVVFFENVLGLSRLAISTFFDSISKKISMIVENKTIEEIVAEKMKRYDRKYFNKLKDDDQTKASNPK